jgi:hypothetical protein
MAKKKKKEKSTEELTKGFEKLLEGKDLNPNNGELFEKVIKKASQPKQRSAK